MIELPESAKDKLTVCGISFAIACLAFTFSVVFLIPLSAQLAVPGFIHAIILLALLFIVPVAGAISGISVGAKAIQKAE
ncbi:MAG: hypothetical protein AAFX93_13415 [Verrucomicrobiota bacterium]